MNVAPVKALLLVVTFSVFKNVKMKLTVATLELLHVLASNCKFTGRDENNNTYYHLDIPGFFLWYVSRYMNSGKIKNILF